MIAKVLISMVGYLAVIGLGVAAVVLFADYKGASSLGEVMTYLPGFGKIAWAMIGTLGAIGCVLIFQHVSRL